MNEFDRAAEDYHKAFYGARLWESVLWMGVPCLKHPLDLWIYQELVFDVRPDVILETGTAYGGTTLYLAHLLDLLGRGHVISIDTERRSGLPMHPRVSYLTGSSTESSMRANVAEMGSGAPVLVILDALHTFDHVRQELDVWSDLVTVGSYLIVEDSNINGHPVFTDWEIEQGPGPFEAVQDFLKSDQRFEPDAAREKFGVTFDPGGYLRRVR